MAALKQFPMGIGHPVVLGIPIKSTPGTVDLTTVTGVQLLPLRPDGSTKTPWVASLAPASDEQAVTPFRALVQYPFQTADLDMRGIWKFQVLLTTPSGVWPGKPEETPELQCTDSWGQ